MKLTDIFIKMVSESPMTCVICGAFTGSNSPYCSKHKPK